MTTHLQSKLKISILEDLKDVASLLREIINNEDDMMCTQLYHTAEDAIHFLPEKPVDILIVDIGLPRASGIEAMVQLSEHCPGMQYCMFTVYEDDDKIFESLKAGAKGYILKSAGPEKVIVSLRELAAGGSPMSPSIARRIIDLYSSLPVNPAPQKLPLTERELELLDHLSKGLLYKEIAIEMGITTGTVKQHIHKIYEKLQLSNTTEAINRYRGV